VYIYFLIGTEIHIECIANRLARVNKMNSTLLLGLGKEINWMKLEDAYDEAKKR